MASAFESGNPYNMETLRHFESPIHAGDLSGQYTLSASAEASESAAGARIQLTIGIEEGKITECRFRVFGCPHLIAAGEWLCQRVEGGTLEELTQLDVTNCLQTLAVPTEKTGRILLLEDAIRSLAGQIQDS